MERDDDQPADAAGSRREARRARREAERAEAGGTAEQRPASGGEAAEASSGRTGPITYLGEVRSELRKVAWPSRSEVLNYSMAVLVMTAVLSGLIFGMDWVIRNLTIQIFG